MKPFSAPHTRNKAYSMIRMVERLQVGLERLSTHVASLSELSGEQLEALELGEPLDAVYQCLCRIEQACQKCSQVVLEDTEAWVDPEILPQDLLTPCKQQGTQRLQFEARQANRLLGELSVSLAQLHNGVDDLLPGIQVPEITTLLNGAAAETI
jgi:hypothetical protein